MKEMVILVNIFIFLYITLILLSGIKVRSLGVGILSYIDELFIIICFILAIRQILISKKIGKNSFNIFLGMILFMILGILSCYLNSSFSLNNLFMSSFLSIKFWLLLFSIENITFDIKQKQAILNSIFFVEKIAIFLGIINLLFPKIYFSIFYFEENYIRFGIRAITSCFNHPSTFGWFMLICSFIHFGLAKKTIQKKNLKKEL